MTRTTLLLFFLAQSVVPTMVLAQNGHTPLPKHVEAKDAAVIPDHKARAISMERSGVAYFTEGFDAGLNGWTVNTPVGSVAWVNTSTGPGTTASTYPVPPLNTSTPSGWMMVDDDFLGVSGVSTDTRLVSPVIDLSTAPPALKVEFDQFFQEWQTDTCYVGVSTDGGATWNEVAVNDGVGRDGRPNPELVDIDISAWVATGPSTVQLRFRYVSTWDYGWQIDNVVITDLPDNDMALLRASHTLYDFPNAGLINAPYTIYPATQLKELQMNGQLKNKGFLPQTGVQLNVEVTGPTAIEFNGSSPSATYAPTLIDSPIINGYTPSGDLGTYDVNYSVTQTETDDVPANNDTTQTFEVTSNTYALDAGAQDGATSQGINNVGDQFELGNYYEFPNAGDYIIGVQVAVDQTSVPGTFIYGVIYDAGLTGPLEYTNDHEILLSDLNPAGGASFITLTLTSPYQAIQGEVYCVMAGHYGGPDDVMFATSGASPEQISIIRYPNTGDNFFVTRTPMVRAIVTDNVGIEELVLGAGDVRFNPNPFNANTTLAFEMTTSQKVTLELMDVTGRTVWTEDLGLRGEGPNTFQINGEDLSSGAYTWRLAAGSAIRTGHLVRE